MRQRRDILACAAVVVVGLLLAAGCENFKWPWQKDDKPAGVDMSQIVVTASGCEKGPGGDFAPSLVTDGNLSDASSWRVEGRGQWIHFDLKQVCTVSAVQMAFVQGKERQYRFAVEISADGNKWQRIFEGFSSGASAGLERFPFPPAQARYVKLVGGGNSDTDPKLRELFGLTEVKIEAVPAAKS